MTQLAQVHGGEAEGAAEIRSNAGRGLPPVSMAAFQATAFALLALQQYGFHGKCYTCAVAAETHRQALLGTNKHAPPRLYLFPVRLSRVESFLGARKRFLLSMATVTQHELVSLLVQGPQA